ncbi:vomeronasal type-2 receptor 26-like [Paroedura picta]|uniref:vomeronasal type-2 receptor 26-like n=1 Tax=Paroedura picta TaxID=143630 RepID=UPI0040577FAD
MKFYQHLLALAFAVYEINENSKILPNVTLGFHIYDSYYDSKMTYRTTIDLLFHSDRFLPNYKCGTQTNVLATIGGLEADVSSHMADILGVYKIPQLTYGSFALEKQDTAKISTFYRMVPNEAYQYAGIIQLLLHFGWVWVGLLTADDESGLHFLKTLELLLAQNGICLASRGRIPNQGKWDNLDDISALVSNVYQSFTDSRANAFILYGGSMTMIAMNNKIFLGDPTYRENAMFRKVWILTAQIDFALSGLQRSWDFDLFHGAISFSIHSREVLDFQKFLHSIQPKSKKGDGFLKDFWEQAFDCTFPDPWGSVEMEDTCTGEERLESLPSSVFEMQMTGHSYSIYNAVYAVAHALNVMSTSRLNPGTKDGRKSIDLQEAHPWQLHSFFQGLSFNNSAGETVSLNGNKEVGAGFDILNLVTLPNKSFVRVKVGRVDPSAPAWFIIHGDLFVWQAAFNQIPPRSVCNDYCRPGYYKKKKEGEGFCCYHCVACPEGKISNQIDMDDCISCPDAYYPSKDQSDCFPKVTSFLSFEEHLGISLLSAIIFLSKITVFVFAAFIKHNKTAIVKANNRSITYTLLISLLLCFLCPLLFLGKPNEVTCFLRQSTFCIISVTVSCVLAKTTTVVVAFMATKPGSSMRKWVGKRLAISIVLSCSLIQVVICTIWLGIWPPVPDFDTKSLTKEIVVGCNEGSTIMFYIVLGYMGLLSIISLTVAFFARKLPDNFNESKHITFSMLVFCSVWVCFVLTYLSSKGKSMVAMEIFSILASSAGLLACIFFPKLYIILLRPQLNNRDLLSRRKN